MTGIALGIVGIFGPLVILLLVIGFCEFMGWGERWLDPPDRR